MVQAGGKVYEYMATGKPIVSVHEPESSASATLSGYPLWFPVTAMDPASRSRRTAARCRCGPQPSA